MNVFFFALSYDICSYVTDMLSELIKEHVMLCYVKNEVHNETYVISGNYL